MAVRKSALIGKTINGYAIKDSRHIGKDTQYLVQCKNCGSEAWKSRGFVKGLGKCPVCGSGRNYHNAKGFEHERLYARYISILRRVKGHDHYKNVKVCDEWVNDYQSFRKWALENGYSDEKTIDRIDNSKGYFPENCRWASAKEQANNRSSNKHVQYNGQTYTVAELSDFIGLPYNTVLQRVKKGWSVDDVVKTPYKSRKKWSEINGTIKN